MILSIFIAQWWWIQQTLSNHSGSTSSPQGWKGWACSLGSLRIKTTTATAAATSLNKRIKEQNNSCACVLQFFVHFFVILWKTMMWNDQILRRLESMDHNSQIFNFLFSNLLLCSGFAIVLAVRNKQITSDYSEIRR